MPNIELKDVIVDLTEDTTPDLVADFLLSYDTSAADIKKVKPVNANISTAKRYVAVLSQTGTNAPVATILENNLGGTPTWAYSGLSDTRYTATLTGAFLSTKTAVFTTLQGYSGNNPGDLLAFRVDNNTIGLRVYDEFGSLTNDWSAYIQILVYP